MLQKLLNTIQSLHWTEITTDRRKVLQPLMDFIQKKVTEDEEINLNFICTHNSRRSHLAQIWAQAAAAYFTIPRVHCYSGGTEITALFPKIAETLTEQGFAVFSLAETDNPVYAVKYDNNSMPVIGFSKKYDSHFNPISGFAAIMTCSQADGGCPFIPGAEKRIPITFEDPKLSDNTPEQTVIYAERSLQVATEMFYVFSKIRK
ncbi:protein-tyrosine-phosphatase [Chryseobacterium sp. JV558]|uniref:protein-tyrosine-phosphatase n=1 Tax=Chryseobacterium sp. JV558 TaxID=2663236 RepID=UPI00299E2D0B|nr:protein-tyrosine-phosphatase [Chryseobacterium sp. JV558]MDW9381519.1 protein-tyrosine-phosphatase [Chryseobacterium sp. JV558]